MITEGLSFADGAFIFAIFAWLGIQVHTFIFNIKESRKDEL